MKAPSEGIRSFNFKKAFIALFAALFVFLAISTIYQAADGQWETAVNFQKSRIEAWSSGDISSMLKLSVSRFTNGGVFNRNPGDRVLYGLAGLMARIDRVEFNVFTIISILFKAAFVILILSWVYVKALNRKIKTT